LPFWAIRGGLLFGFCQFLCYAHQKFFGKDFGYAAWLAGNLNCLSVFGRKMGSKKNIKKSCFFPIFSKNDQNFAD